MSDLESLFKEAFEIARVPCDGVIDADKKQIYGLYKRITKGTCEASGEAAPYKVNFMAYGKYMAWKACDDLSEDEAKLKYCQIVAKFGNEAGQAFAKKMAEYES